MVSRGRVACKRKGKAGGDKQRQAAGGSQKADRGRVAEQGKSLRDKERQPRGRLADMQTCSQEAKKGSDIQT
jgi:hypothetical protein